MQRRARRIVFVLLTAILVPLFIAPQPTHAQDGDCSVAPPSYLTIGDLVVVSPQGTISFINDRPLVTGTHLTTIGPGDEVDILDGPVCDRGYRWWKVRTASGQEGWIFDGDGGSTTFVVIAPANMPDIVEPPPPPDSAPYTDCSGAPPNILSRGLAVMVPADQAPNVLRITRGTENNAIGQLEAGIRATILDGPDCYAGQRWWNVDIPGAGLRGWTPDGLGSERWLVPYEDAPQNTSCPGTPEDYLYPNIVAWVAPGNANNVRSGPGTGYAVLFQLAAQVRFTLLEGPICADGYRWWRIRTPAGQEGWTADGSGAERWLATNYQAPQAPITPTWTPTQPITPSPTATPTVTATPTLTATPTVTRTPTSSPTPDRSNESQILSVTYDYLPEGYVFSVDVRVVGHAHQAINLLLWFKHEDGEFLPNGAGNPEFMDANGLLFTLYRLLPNYENTVYLEENGGAVKLLVPYEQFPVSNGGYAFAPYVELRSETATLTVAGPDDGTPRIQVGGCLGDHDCDGLSDELEQWLVDTYKPVLEFDEEEPVDASRYTATLYQVSPGTRQDGTRGAWITIVILYPLDGGMTAMHRDGWTCLGIGDATTALGNLGADGHAGDTEGVRLFVADRGGGDWELTGLLMKRHYDPWEWYSVTTPYAEERRFEYRQSPEGQGTYSHPLLYVSESKHGMYATVDECEHYGHDIYPGCEFKLEDCGDDDNDQPRSMGLYTPFEHNVGERYAPTEPLQLNSAAARLFGNEHTWIGEEFCGGQNMVVGNVLFETCAGSLRGKWLPQLSYDIAGTGVEIGWIAELNTGNIADDSQMWSFVPARVEYAPIWAR